MNEIIKLEELKEVYTMFGLTRDQVLGKFQLAGREDYARFYTLPIDQHSKYGGKNGLYCYYLYFAIASLVLKNVKNILEIGTNKGKSANLLARLFPGATIYTVDKNEVEDEFKENIKKPNIKFIKSDSFFLPSLDLPKLFELIWIDGALFYPQVKNDIMFAYDHLRRGGFLIKSCFGPSRYTDVGGTINGMRNVIEEK
ncbi:unnamed protein product, partial [marine sediment metagenome]